MAKQPRVFTAEFKTEAVRLATQAGNTPSRVARDLGVSVQVVSRWVQEHKTASSMGRPSFPGRGTVALSDQEKRIKELEHEVNILKQEREILKAAAKFFLTPRCT